MHPSSAPAVEPLIENPAALLATLFAVLALIFWLSENRRTARLFRIIPPLVFCYFVPTALTTLGAYATTASPSSAERIHRCAANLGQP